MTTPKNTTNGWPEHARLVLATQGRHEELLKRLVDNVARNGRDIHLLKWQARRWGLAAGTMGTGLVLLIKYLLSGTT